MAQEFISPTYWIKAFTCPHCWVLSKQEWTKLFHQTHGKIYIAVCDHCEKYSVWNIFTEYRGEYWYLDADWIMIYPKITSIPSPNEDLEEEIITDYLEAGNILSESPLWACALLRLALQKLMIQLGESWADINKDIWSLVSKWLNPTIQKALDTVRVVWNESVHPWLIDMKDNREMAVSLFHLINFIANFMITQPKEIDEIYSGLPEVKLEWIKNRDINS